MQLTSTKKRKTLRMGRRKYMTVLQVLEKLTVTEQLKAAGMAPHLKSKKSVAEEKVEEEDNNEGKEDEEEVDGKDGNANNEASHPL